MAELQEDQIYQFRVTLKGIEPSIWRRFQFRGSDSFLALHLALQAFMGWENMHLYQFNVGQIELTDAETAAEFGAHDAEATSLQALVKGPEVSFRYLYDFGDSWEHDLFVEKLHPAEPGIVYPRCLAGQRACPPEDCGGAWGYTYFLKDLAAGALEDSWGEEFDPEAFDVTLANQRLGWLFSR
ncbi:MAG: plasmid pRiA4b ORF-3 family protein [Candidatus Promineifilaceae bacterium]|nr:plasmid pRiA4b ORF-3 family protein [Candidatus Promineifilaceae bacterium]